MIRHWASYVKFRTRPSASVTDENFVARPGRAVRERGRVPAAVGDRDQAPPDVEPVFELAAGGLRPCAVGVPAECPATARLRDPLARAAALPQDIRAARQPGKRVVEVELHHGSLPVVAPLGPERPGAEAGVLCEPVARQRCAKAGIRAREAQRDAHSRDPKVGLGLRMLAGHRLHAAADGACNQRAQPYACRQPAGNGRIGDLRVFSRSAHSFEARNIRACIPSASSANEGEGNIRRVRVHDLDEDLLPRARCRASGPNRCAVALQNEARARWFPIAHAHPHPVVPNGRANQGQPQRG